MNPRRRLFALPSAATASRSYKTSDTRAEQKE